MPDKWFCGSYSSPILLSKYSYFPHSASSLTDLKAFSDAFDEFDEDAITYAVIRSSYFLTAFIAVLLATFFSVLIPLRVLKKFNPN